MIGASNTDRTALVTDAAPQHRVYLLERALVLADAAPAQETLTEEEQISK